MFVEEYLASIYGGLIEPPEALLPANQVLRFTRDEEQRLLMDLDLAGEPVEIHTKPLTVDGSGDDFSLAVAPQSYGRTVYVETELDNGGRRRVRFADLLDLDSISLRTSFPTGPTEDSGAIGAPEQVALYRNGTELRVRIQPPPVANRTYTFYYTAGENSLLLPGQQLAISKGAPTFYNLLIANVKLLCLPFCAHIADWQRTGIAASIDQQVNHPLNGLNRLWNSFRSNANFETDGFADGFSLGEQSRGPFL